MEEHATLKLTVTEYIQRLSKELNIEGTKGLFGNELELIALVRNCQFLYDKNLPDFKNIQKKNEAWEAIASVFEVTVGEVQQRWKGMRDLFSKHKNKNEGQSNNNKNVVCPYYDDLKFLEPYIVGRRSRLVGVTMSLSDHLNSDDDASKEKESASFDDLRRFIDKIKNSPILYHHRYSGGSYGKQKLEHWIEIAKVFGVPVKECLARWRTLRERYSRERRMQNAGVSVKKWELFDELSFLDQHVKRRRRYTRMVPTHPSPADQNICYVVTSPTNSSSEHVTLDSSAFLNEMSLGTKKEVAMDDVEFFDVSSDITSSPTPLFNEDISASENNVSENSVNVQNESTQCKVSNPDEDDLFGQSIAAELKKIPCPRKKIKLKAEIYRLIYEHTCE
ncbi:transcription factor Adf-1-like isoform X2 [Tribolium madens]|uniref:transcription factor Adf-1-like isoform X2 n=1 Tax=Tribolium madens TaxID=41895 RepID=UPI001CF7253D|nr:transcription factor Adf-1-like isoform X2 [Tribolium madens]